MGVQFAGNILVQSNGGPLPISQGGTGQTSAAAAINALLPAQAGQSGKYLTTNGTTASWATSSVVTPGGSDGYLQYNDSGSFGGSSFLTINKSTGAITSTSTLSNQGLLISKAAANARSVTYQTAGSDRWILGVDATAESGTNAGSNFQLIRIADNGSTQNTVYTISRANGVVDFKATPTVNGTPIGSGSGTVTSVAVSSANGALTVSGSPITSSGTISITANNFTSSVAGVVPASGGGTTNFLRADGTWAAAGGTPAGSNTQIQYNNSGAFGASSAFAWDNSSTTLTVGPQVGASGGTVTIGPPDGSGIGAGTSVLIKATSTSNNFSSNPGSITLQAGSLTGDNGNGSSQGGSINISAGNSVVSTFNTGTGGNVIISGGLGIAGSTLGYVAVKTGITGSLTERLRILNNGAWSVGSTGTATGTSGQVLTSTGSTTAPTWQDAPGAAAGTLTGTTLASNVVSSSLTSVGTITSGTWSGSFGAVSGANLTSLNASNLATGTVGTARMGSGTANNTTFLRGDGTWATPTASSTSLSGTGSLILSSSTTGAFGGVSGSTPYFGLVNTGGAVDNRASYIEATTTGLNWRLSNDAISTNTVFMGVTRSSTTASLITFTSTGFNLAVGTSGLQLNGSAGTSGQVLTSNGAAAAPTWQSVSASTATNISGGATNQIPFQSAASTTAFSAALTWTNSTNTMVLGTTSATPTVVQAPDVSTGSTAASSLTVRGGDGGSATVNAGALILRGGNYTSSANAGGAAVTITGGSHTGSGTTSGASGGAVTITGGTGGASSAGPGGNVTISGGVGSGTGAGGNLVLNGGTTTSGTTGGFISFSTTAAAGAVTERFRILANGAWSVGTAGTATGTANAPLISGGSSAVPTWASNFTWDSTNRIMALGVNSANGAVTIQTPDVSSGTSAGMTIGPGTGTGVNAGSITIRGGNSTTSSSGFLALNGGSGGTVGGAVTISAGQGSTTNGSVTMSAGASVGTNSGGSVTISAGGQTTSTGNGGNLTLNAGSVGNNSTGGTGGTVNINAGSTGDSFSGPATAAGAINISAGSCGQQTAAGGAINITAGFGSTGGNLTLTAGSAGGTGGNLILNAGNGTSTGGPTGGDIFFTSGNGTARNERFRITNNGVWALNGSANVGTNGQYLRTTGSGVSWTTVGNAPSNLALSSGTYIGTGTFPEMTIVNTSATANNRVWETRVNNSGTFFIAVDDDTFASSTTVFSMTRTGNTVNTIAFTGTAMTQSGTFQATTVNVTGSTAPANGVYLPAANSVGISTGSTEGIRIDSSGNLLVQRAGAGLRVKEGTNAKMGVSTLVAGTVVVSNTSVTANSRIFLTTQSVGGTAGFLVVSARTAGTSFTILSSSATDTSVVAWMIVEPA